MLYLKPGIPQKPTYPPEYESQPYDDAGIPSGAGLMDEDLVARQTAQMRVEDVEGERHRVMGGPS